MSYGGSLLFSDHSRTPTSALAAYPVRARRPETSPAPCGIVDSLRVKALGRIRAAIAMRDSCGPLAIENVRLSASASVSADRFA